MGSTPTRSAGGVRSAELGYYMMDMFFHLVRLSSNATSFFLNKHANNGGNYVAHEYANRSP